jgi:hypothetical protein
MHSGAETDFDLVVATAFRAAYLTLSGDRCCQSTHKSVI